MRKTLLTSVILLVLLQAGLAFSHSQPLAPSQPLTSGSHTASLAMTNLEIVKSTYEGKTVVDAM